MVPYCDNYSILSETKKAQCVTQLTLAWSLPSLIEALIWDLNAGAYNAVNPLAPALGGQGGHVPTLKIIWVGIAHPGFFSLERVLGRTAHPVFCLKMVPYCDNYSILSETKKLVGYMTFSKCVLAYLAYYAEMNCAKLTYANTAETSKYH